MDGHGCHIGRHVAIWATFKVAVGQKFRLLRFFLIIFNIVALYFLGDVYFFHFFNDLLMVDAAFCHRAARITATFNMRLAALRRRIWQPCGRLSYDVVCLRGDDVTHTLSIFLVPGYRGTPEK